MSDKNCYVCQKDTLKKHICKECYYKVINTLHETIKDNTCLKSENKLLKEENELFKGDYIRLRELEDIVHTKNIKIANLNKSINKETK